MEFLSFDNNNKLNGVKPGHLFYLKKTLYISDQGLTNNVSVVFIDSEKDITDSKIDEIAKRLNSFNTDKKEDIIQPILVIGTKALNDRDHKNISQKKCFLDSSIWIKYIHDERKSINHFRKEIMNTIELFKSQTEIRKSKVAQEYIEFNSRMCIESKLKIKGGHGENISPFIFHSETRMHEDTAELINKLRKSNLTWEVLLVDDYAEIKLDGAKNNDTTKLKIIENILDKRNTSKLTVNTIPVTHNSEIESKSKNIIWQTLLKLSEKTYDIILLDYLLGKANNKYEDREYSHELLNVLNNIFKNEKGYGGNGKDRSIEPTHDEILRYHPNCYEKKKHSEEEELKDEVKEVVEGIKKHKGPLNKLWIMNISSFHIAFLDRLREQGLGYNNRNWTLSRGADPVNTPHLFTYNLFRFMNLQIDEANIDTHEMLNQFFDELNELDISLQDWASSYYQVFINRFGKFNILKQDRKKSAFSSSFYHYLINEKTGELETYERFRNFLFLLANGTKQDFGQLMRSFNELTRIIEYENSHRKEENHSLMNKLKQQIIKEFPQ